MLFVKNVRSTFEVIHKSRRKKLSILNPLPNDYKYLRVYHARPRYISSKNFVRVGYMDV